MVPTLVPMESEMKHAAKKKKMFHLWWHPHNFGGDPTRMLKQLNELLLYFSILKTKYGFESNSMSEYAQLALEDEL